MSSAVTVTFIWLGATVAHFLLTGRAANRLGHADETPDDRIYAAVIGGIASLSIVVHATAVTVGLGLTSGLVALGLWHAVLWRVASSGQRSAASTPFMSRTTVTDRLALTVWLGIVISWVGAAAASANILGPDNHLHEVTLGEGTTTIVDKATLSGASSPTGTTDISARVVIPTEMAASCPPPQAASIAAVSAG